MGSNDVPPPHVPASYHAMCTLLLGTGGLLYTVTYVLMTRQSLRDRTYAMPLFSLGFNFAWEIVFALYVAEALQEKTIFVIWMIIDVGLVYAVVKHGANEWTHAPVVGRHIGKILAGFVMWWCWALYAVSSWWVDLEHPVNPKDGKFYRGLVGADTTELGFWTALAAQVVLSCLLLAQISVRGTSGGASYAIWATRFVGSLFGLNLYYGYCWYVWREAHEYFMHPLAVCFWITWPVADVAYLAVLRSVKQTEIVLKNGRKIRGGKEGLGKREPPPVRATSTNDSLTCPDIDMASSDDEDLNRAIALSMGQPWPPETPGAKSESNVVDLISDEEDGDEELRQAIALSLQESEAAASEAKVAGKPIMASGFHPSQYASKSLGDGPQTEATPAASQPPDASSGFLGLDRKAMEQERLARLGKRKRDPSPEASSKIAKPAAPSSSKDRINKTPSPASSALQYPQGTIKRTWAFKHPRTNDIKLEEVLQLPTLSIAVLSSWQWDMDWHETKLDFYKIKQIWIMSAKGEDLQEQWRKEIKESRVPNFKAVFPPMGGQIMNMHSKLMLLFHSTHLRVVIPTANMMKLEWGETEKDPRTGESWQPAVLENSVFLIDLPRREDAKVGKREELTKFGKGLYDFLEAQEVGKNVLEGMLKFDFSETGNIAFVHSIGGSHTGKAGASTGLPGLCQAVRDLNLHDVKYLELDYTAASLGAVKRLFLKQIYSAACGESSVAPNLPDKVLERIRIFFPTNETVVNSTGGTDCGGIITFSRSHYDSAEFPTECMRDHKSTRPGVLSHSKLLFARGRKKDGTPIAWVYVGSANISESAWGSQKVLKTGSVGKLNIRNWESGVVVPVSEEKLKGLELEDDQVPPMSVFEGTMEVPFEYPGDKYGDRKPWFFKG
ncbi:phospholipase D/nuclease [Corynespora cassiicola Philippines]|uniref:Phospholipase D/nuclease n=1 Tax=Corynespora cassiicola Philippines TaxID=1448308 RepID=A0A2T2NK00_CORCC|nr:phospholipase D/nuclease [Corynespora cassiicola Philippines]